MSIGVSKFTEVFYIDYDGVKPAVTFGQVVLGGTHLAFIERLKKNYPDTKFWHSWHFDWKAELCLFPQCFLRMMILLED